MREINKIIIHCSDSPDSNTKVNAKTIDLWHRSRGWSGIGYHFVVLKSGIVEKGRDLKRFGAHTKGHNKDSIGIVWIGRNDFNLEQKKSMQELVEKLWKDFGKIPVYGHRDFTNLKTCPNFNVKKWMETWKKTKKTNIFKKLINLIRKLIKK